jgi:hypothetical protein
MAHQLSENHFKPFAKLHPDAKGRITLGKVSEGVSSYYVSMDELGRLLLEPYMEIPAQEKWLYENKEALRRVKQGLKDAAEGKTHYLGSFSNQENE